MSVSEAPVAVLGRNFSAVAEHNPCEGCSAPCCRLVITNHDAPTTFHGLDHLRYLVAHEGAELLLNRNGHWQLSTRNPCTLLTDEGRCSVHGTPRKPKICVNYDPIGCWYKRNFHETDDPPDLIRMDLAGFERILDHITFDDEGDIVDVPPYDELRRLAAPTDAGRTL